VQEALLCIIVSWTYSADLVTTWWSWTWYARRSRAGNCLRVKSPEFAAQGAHDGRQADEDPVSAVRTHRLRLLQFIKSILQAANTQLSSLGPGGYHEDPDGTQEPGRRLGDRLELNADPGMIREVKWVAILGAGPSKTPPGSGSMVMSNR